MVPSDSDMTALLDAVDALREEVSLLRERVSALEGREQVSGPAARAVRSAGAEAAALPDQTEASTRGPAPDQLDPDLVCTIAAAVAAYLGMEPHIRSVRLVRSHAWAQQGRATIQAWYSVSPPSTARGGDLS